MLPRCPDSTAKSTLEGRLDCMSLHGYDSVARENVDLNRYAAACRHIIWQRHDSTFDL